MIVLKAKSYYTILNLPMAMGNQKYDHHTLIKKERNLYDYILFINYSLLQRLIVYFKLNKQLNLHQV